jgi:3-oxoadipate enol-lactonase
VTERFIEHDGLRFRIRLDGREGAPWMVLSNSLVTDLTVWDKQVEAFGDRYRILRYDQRGHGRTSVPPQAATIAQLAEDAAALMREVGAEDAVFAGVSMGAATGFCLAQRHPELVARLVASDGQVATAPGGAASWAERIAVGRDKGMAGYAEITLQRWFSVRSRAEGNPAMGKIRAMIEATPLDGFVACARALQDYDFRAGLPGMRQPTLLIAGAEDGPMPQSMRALAALIPDARFVEIADAGHIPGLERPAEFNAALTQFLG